MDRRPVFRRRGDQLRFLELLQQACTRFDLTMLAYTLMTSDVHLVVRRGARPLAEGMKALLGPYASYFNERHDCSGHLWQTRYVAKLYDSEFALLTLIRSVHAKPVRAGLVRHPADHEFSSARWYLHGEAPA